MYIPHLLLPLAGLIAHNVAAELRFPPSQALNLTVRPSQPTYTQPIDATHDIQIFRYKYHAPDRPYIAALVSASNVNFAAYRSSHYHIVPSSSLYYSAYGIAIAIENLEQRLTYELVGGVFEALGRFLIEKRMCDADFGIREGEVLVGSGSIERDPLR